MEARVLVAIVACGMSAVLPRAAAALPATTTAGFAVVELFTSEGCSSCPPADEALSHLSQRAAKDGLRIFALEWHVDYWDPLGWKDPFGSRAATARQYAYARTLPSAVYTPQMVLNGSVVPTWAGDLDEIDRDARTILAAPTAIGLRLQILPGRAAGSVSVRVDAEGAPADTHVLLALTEDGLGATPTAGENEGRRLTHSSVVRALASLPSPKGETAIDVPAGVDRSKSWLVALLEDPRTMRILAANRAPLAGNGVTLHGRVIDGHGNGLDHVIVQACSGAMCVPALSRSDGSFTFSDLTPGKWSLLCGRAGRPVEVVLEPGSSPSTAVVLRPAP